MDTDEHRWGRISRDTGVPPMLDAPEFPGNSAANEFGNSYAPGTGGTPVSR
ncbi:MAG: hypothetical protein JWP03_5301 [Phycisphaerales bacterium]|jgi:hypothetical protein|nr:hypothetical protein [Phycisphaerales bacterium]